MPENNYWLQTKDDQNRPFLQFSEYLRQFNRKSKSNLENIPSLPKNSYGRTYYGHPIFNLKTAGPKFVEDGGNI